jgi:hypothetical protein
MSEMDWEDEEHCRYHVHIHIHVHVPDLLGRNNFRAYNGYPYLDYYYYVDPQRSYSRDYCNNPLMYGKTWGELDKILESPQKVLESLFLVSAECGQYQLYCFEKRKKRDHFVHG